MSRFLTFVAVLFLFAACGTPSSNSGDSEMDVFVSDLMAKMTIQEKIGQLNLITPGGGIPTGSVVSTGVEEKIKTGKVGGIFGVYGPEKTRQAQQLAVEESRLGIPMIFGSDVIHGYKTTFPLPLGLASTWDMELIEKTAQIAAKEATADGIFWNFSPMVDVSRDPRWGRISEGAGEDPYLGSEIAKAMVNGYQQDDLTATTTMMATVKHFALYGAAEAGRDYNSVDMSHLRMFNEYFPPYKAAIDAGVGCVMSSFNDVDGIPATGNKWLLTTVLRDMWGFDGFVVSDYTSVNEMIAHGLGDLQAVSALSLKAGLDMDMVGEGFLTTLEKSLEEGKVTEEDINIACRRILEAKYKLGLFEDPYRYFDNARPENDILTAEHRKVAREAAARSMVLLKNENQLLPLKKSGTVALVGPLVDSRSNMLGTWAPTGDFNYAVTVLEGFENVVGNDVNILHAKGANICDDPEFAAKVNVFGPKIFIDERSPETMIREAVSVSRKADVIVAVVGEATEMTGESSSRTDITMPPSQKKLLRELAKTGKPLVVVNMSGRPMVIGEEVELADAFVQMWHAGVEGGNALPDVLFGDYNPSGKLTATFPVNVGQVPIYYSVRNTGRPQDGDTFQKFKSNYLDAPNSPLFPFGYGLSYTTFEYKDLVLDKSTFSSMEEIKVSVSVTNTGDFDGEEVVQLYVHDKVASITPPLRLLKGFRKVFIPKGDTKEVVFTLQAADLAFYHADLSYYAEAGEFEVYVGGDSNASMATKFTLQ
ncbi:beta-glucosidase BglX [Draconibacterium sp. IB214405]|uniref:beta-glucosidase BglX n=1 Tax=Draconibacterium sp. IB214405 TaxID=3097352 RepID=UPI002A17E248|nr:beta-glucosidase BglX [Draconibacterium sp. IB214405]MDX8339006.1 beta-glucosidase BglX [Draconibacterium sp. IB214405]